jgi:hypothetical protein
MNGVVLRCRNCGTTQRAPGECEACHEAEVHYFCSNHKPGLWLDGPSCSHCGARFGAPTRPPATPPVTERPPRPRVATRRRATTSPPSRAYRTEGRLPPVRDAGPKRPDAPPDRSVEARRAEEILWRLPDLFRSPPRRRGPWDVSGSSYPTSPLRPHLGGCLRIVLVLAFIFMMLFIFGPALIGALLMQLMDGY